MGKARADNKINHHDHAGVETCRARQRKTREARGFFLLRGAHGLPKGFGKADNVLIRKELTQGIQRLAQICKDSGVVLMIQFSPISEEVVKARDLSPLEAWSREVEASHARRPSFVRSWSCTMRR
jgi:hypothetical protein